MVDVDEQKVLCRGQSENYTEGYAKNWRKLRGNGVALVPEPLKFAPPAVILRGGRL